MDLEFIYHNDNKEPSIFKDKILNLVRDNEIKVVCPYIDLEILEDIIKTSKKSWKLITDIKKWFFSRKKQEHQKILNFIKSNIKNIKDIKGVHAKAIILENKVFLGSSNLTNSGLNRNIELSIIIENNEKIRELDEWFNNLWEKTRLCDIEKLDLFFQSISDSDDSSKKFEFDDSDLYTNEKIIDIDNNFKFDDALLNYKIKDDINLYCGKDPEKNYIWKETAVIITKDMVKPFKNEIDENKYQKFLNNHIEDKVVYSSTVLIFGALLGYYSLIANRIGKGRHQFYIINTKLASLKNLEIFGFIFDINSKKFSFDKSKIALRKNEMPELKLLIKRYYQLYTSNSVMYNPSCGKAENLFSLWESNAK